MTEEDYDDCDTSILCMVVFGIAIGISQILIGLTIVSILMYSLDTSFIDIHIALCTFGFHFLAAEGILTMNAVSGCLDERGVRYRVYAHAFLQFCAVVFIVTGTILIAIETGITQTTHGISGIITTVLAVLTMVGGITSCTLGWPFRIIHIIFGIPTFIASSVCMISGILKPELKTWLVDSLPSNSHKVIIVFICVYTTLISLMALLKLVTKIKDPPE